MSVSSSWKRCNHMVVRTSLSPIHWNYKSWNFRVAWVTRFFNTSFPILMSC